MQTVREETLERGRYVTVLTLILAVTVVALAAVLAWDRLDQRARRRDREIVRRIQTYLAQLPPRT